MLRMSTSNIIFESEPFSRVTEVLINGKQLITPTYFPAVSSYGIKYPFNALVRLLTAYSYPRLLISAYDFYLLSHKMKKDLSQEIHAYSKKGCFVFLDSRIYESFWKADAKWTYDLYKTVVSEIDFDFYCSFDVLPDVKSQTVQFTQDTLDSILASRNLSYKPGFVPILHGLSPDKLTMKPLVLPLSVLSARISLWQIHVARNKDLRYSTQLFCVRIVDTYLR